MMRKIALILCVFMLFSLVACNNGGDESNTSSTFSSASSAASSEATSGNDSSDVSSAASSEASDDSSDASSDVSDESSDDVSDESSDVSDDETDEPVEYGTLFIGKAATAPVVDGEVGENEYATSIKFDASKAIWNANSSENVDAYNAVLYISWDEEYLYTAIALGVGRPRTYGNTDYLQNRPYIFDRRHVMAAVTLGDPTDPKYIPSGAQQLTDDPTSWDWGAAASSKLGNEWTTTAQPDGSNICTDHFGSLTESEGWEYIVAVSKLETEIYEQRIPWSALYGYESFEAKSGATIGYAFSACCEEVDIEAEEDDAPYVCFGAGIIDGKSFSRYVGLTLKD